MLQKIILLAVSLQHMKLVNYESGALMYMCTSAGLKQKLDFLDQLLLEAF